MKRFDPELYTTEYQDEYCIIVRDNNAGGRSITNAAEDMVWFLYARGELSPPPTSHRGALKRLFYRDTTGVYDEIVFDWDGKFQRFQFLGAKSVEEVLEKIAGDRLPLEDGVHRWFMNPRGDWEPARPATRRRTLTDMIEEERATPL